MCHFCARVILWVRVSAYECVDGLLLLFSLAMFYEIIFLLNILCIIFSTDKIYGSSTSIRWLRHNNTNLITYYIRKGTKTQPISFQVCFEFSFPSSLIPNEFIPLFYLTHRWETGRRTIFITFKSIYPKVNVANIAVIRTQFVDLYVRLTNKLHFLRLHIRW